MAPSPRSWVSAGTYAGTRANVASSPAAPKPASGDLLRVDVLQADACVPIWSATAGAL